MSAPCHSAALQSLYSDKKHTIRRAGVCTSYLENKLNSWLNPGNKHAENQNGRETHEVQTVRIFLKPTLSFHLPADSSTPIILVGPGTGVAPFIGFLQHRAALESNRLRSGEDMIEGIWRGNFELSDVDLPTESNAVGQFMRSSSLGAALLFFGCRDDSDFLYKKELEGHLEDGSLSSLDVAFSRKSHEKVYVTHKILAKAEEVGRLILAENAHVFICGDGNKMAIDVQAAIKSALIKHGTLSESDAESMMSDLKLRRRLVMDIWS
jgi:sulfite reductase alpha subunit-like flavoprotein